ncbi:MAG TPA: NADH:flavin oxidoreductase/NADH oxidase family protein [Acidimicrobiales bacterium]|jgi:2,4-dienoyl-CoA reductase-like NADH-dependent reductase (Old Yellow Enzyme family)
MIRTIARSEREAAPVVELGTPLTLGCGTRLPNRIAKAAMTEQLADRAGHPTDALVTLFSRWSAGGSGLLITGGVLVDPRWPSEPYVVVIEDRDLDCLSRWSAGARSGGGQAWMQLNHPGRQVLRTVTRRSVAPSVVKSRYRGLLATSRELDGYEIVGLIERFGRAARIAERAGFTGVELHAAHGYLHSQFLSPLTNRRADDWGGTPEKRMRFLLESLRSIRSQVASSFAVGVKLNSADFQRGGFTEEESMGVVAALNDERIDLLEVTGGTYEAPVMDDGRTSRQSTLAREAYFLEYARKVRSIAEMPIMLSGGIARPEMMRQLVAEGAVDVVGLARALAVMPDLPGKVLAERPVGAVPSPPQVRARSINLGLNGPWYAQQIHRLSRGEEPNPRRGLMRTAVAHASLNIRWRLGWNRPSKGARRPDHSPEGNDGVNAISPRTYASHQRTEGPK